MACVCASSRIKARVGGPTHCTQLTYLLRGRCPPQVSLHPSERYPSFFPNKPPLTPHAMNGSLTPSTLYFIPHRASLQRPQHRFLFFAMSAHCGSYNCECRELQLMSAELRPWTVSMVTAEAAMWHCSEQQLVLQLFATTCFNRHRKVLLPTSHLARTGVIAMTSKQTKQTRS